MVSGVSVYKLDKVALGCVFPMWAIISIAVGSTLVIVIAVVLNRTLTWITYQFYKRFTNDDDSQDVLQMKYDVFVSCRYQISTKYI